MRQVWWILDRFSGPGQTAIFEWTAKKAVDKYFSIIFYKKISGIYILNEDVARAVKNIIQIFKFLWPEKDFPEVGRELGY